MGVTNIGNPLCPEPNCHRILRLKKLKVNIGFSPCPKCRTERTKRYILTPLKEGLFRCVQCHNAYKPKRREGLTKFFICKDHPWQKFKVGAEVILCKSKPKSMEEIMRDLKVKPVEQATKRQRRQPNVRTR